MKAAIHLALFLTTMYEYFFPTKKTDSDSPVKNDIESSNRDELIPYGHGEEEAIGDGFTRVRSLSEVRTTRRAQSMFEFDDENEEEENHEHDTSHYTSLANDELEKWQREKEQEGIVSGVRGRVGRIITSTNKIVNKYAKRRNEMNQMTINNSETLKDMRDYMTQKRENAQAKISQLVSSGKVTNEFKRELNEDFVTI